jgi:hypothetical protein
MNNGMKWNPQTLGGNYFKEMTWNHLFHTYAIHTDAHLIVNRMLRLYTTDECRFCKARFAIYNVWQRQDTYREFLKHILKHDLNLHNTYGCKRRYQAVGTLLTHWINMHISRVHTYPSIWAYMLNNQPETLLQLIGSKYYSVEPTTDNPIVIYPSLEDITICAIFKPILIHALKQYLEFLNWKEHFDTYRSNKGTELNTLYRSDIEWIFCSYCRIENPIGQCHRHPGNNTLNA